MTLLTQSEIDSIFQDYDDCVSTAVGCRCAYGGTESEAYWHEKNSVGMARVRDEEATFYAGISKAQFDRVNTATSWDSLGVQSSADVKITIAGLSALKAMPLTWQKRGSDKLPGPAAQETFPFRL